MSIYGRRGLDNVLLRWVKRHQSMTTLFRAHDNVPAKPVSYASMPSIVQAKYVDMPRSDHAPVASAPTLDSTLSLHSVESPLNSPSLKLPASAATAEKPAVPSSTPAASKPAPKASGNSDPVWRRLQTIFRKHQESDATDSVNMPDTPVSVEQTPQQEMSQSPHYETEYPKSEEAKQFAGHSPVIQRSGENLKNSAPVDRSQAVKINQVPTSRAAQAAMDSDSSESNQGQSQAIVPEETPGLPEQVEAKEASQLSSMRQHSPSLEPPSESAPPLQSVWNVQRLADSEAIDLEEKNTPLTNPTSPTETPVAGKIHQTIEQEASHPSMIPGGESEDAMEVESTQSTTTVDSVASPDSSPPVEILSPSRPRPAQTIILPSNQAIQRQPENRKTPVEINDSRLVETAIGPLPADLWQLVGQKPPSNAYQPEERDEAIGGFHQEEIVKHPKETSKPPASSPEQKSVHTVQMPEVIQREAIPQESSSQPEQQQSTSLSPEKITQAEADLDQLAHRVYAEIRHRLSLEWERMRRR